MARLIISATILLLTSCAGQSRGKVLVLQYADFGPPSPAHELIGMDWWQWLDHADSRPLNYDIQVIVYRDFSLENIRETYPTDPSHELDYRYLRYSDAMKYLDRMIEENAIVSLTTRLQVTRQQIVKSLPAVERRAY
jgi:hypothetical protein